MESTGAFFPGLALHMLLLGRLCTVAGTHDSTAYGKARCSTKAFFRHHASAMTGAAVLADADTRRQQRLTPPPP